jgi:hypothetical protein
MLWHGISCISPKWSSWTTLPPPVWQHDNQYIYCGKLGLLTQEHLDASSSALVQLLYVQLSGKLGFFRINNLA